MVTTLVPTVHERIARCNTSIYVDGLVPGADVIVAVDAVEHNFTASGGSFHLTVPSLSGGEKVKAKQDAGAGFTPWSPEVEVEQVILPPVTLPHLPDEVGACSQCVHVYGLVPGSEIELFVGGDIVGKGNADRGGAACVGVDLSKQQGEGFGFLGARMIVCGTAGPEAGTPIVARGALPKPEIIGPLFGCQRVVPTRNIDPGSRVRYEMDSVDLGSFCSCWEAANVWVGMNLVSGKSVRAIAYFDSDACKDESTPSAWEPVVPPDDRIKPVVEPALVEGDRTIRVSNQIAGASLTIRIRPDAAQPFEAFGPRQVSPEPEIDLNAPLVAGNVVTVVQTLCSVSVESDPVTVLPPPPVVLPPVVLAPLYECATGVQVSNLHQGAYVRVFADGVPIGTRWAGNATSIAVPANLVAGWKITATQTVAGIVSNESDPAVWVQVASLGTPRVMPPVALGDTAVGVSHVTPGAHVAIWSGATKLGQVDATEPVVRVPVSPVPGPVHASARLCGREVQGQQVEPIEDPCGPGPFAGAAEMFKKFDDFDVPAVTDGDPFTMPMEGQLYFPSDDGKSWARGAHGLPLVIIAHGFWQQFVDSYLGYDYLARHLARWGMVVFSLNLDEVNGKTSNVKPHEYSRGEIILRAIDELQNDTDVKERVDFGRIGLIGHSMGGEGVTLAQHLNDDGGRGYGIRGVVSIAPTNHRQEITLRRTRYLQLLGSMDLLSHSALSEPRFNGFGPHDRAWRPKSHAWIYGARHNPFNRSWVASGDTFESGWADLALPAADHEQIAQCLINAFFQDALIGRSTYAGYLQGVILPRSLQHLEIHMQHGHEPQMVIDNFGDLDEQEPLPAEGLSKTQNSLHLPATASGTGLTIWEDVDHQALAATTPHKTLAVELAWDPQHVPDVQYTTESGGIAASPLHVVALRVGQFYEDAKLNAAGVAADVFVTLDDNSAVATVRVGVIAPIPYPDVQMAAARLCPMRTVRIPMDAFTAVNPAFDLGNIVRVTVNLTARPTGHILVDDIEIGL